MSFEKQIELAFRDKKEKMLKRVARNRKIIYPFTIENLRKIMDTPDSVQQDPEKFIEWIKENRKKRFQAYLK